MNQPINELPVNEMNYEQAKQQLIAVIKRMETGNLPLEETLNIWERGEQLAAHCQSILDQARQRIATHPPAVQASKSRSGTCCKQLRSCAS